MLLSLGQEMLLVWSVNLLTGVGLLALGIAMLRRPERVWVGVRVVHNEREGARVRRANAWAAPWLVILGMAQILSGPVALAAGISPLSLAIGGLVLLLLAILALVTGALLSR